MATGDNGKIDCPRNNADVKRFLRQVGSHPDSKEYRIRVAGLLAEVQARNKNMRVTQWSQLRHGSVKNQTAKRLLLHDKIVKELVVEESQCNGNDPLAIILLGPPGAGKTSVGVPLAKERHNVIFSSVNPDDVKERLPEYDGWNASALHEESSYVSEAMIKTHVISSRCHMIYDITGKRSNKVQTAIEELAEYGYNVHLLLMDLEPWRAVCRVWSRFQENAFGRLDDTKPCSRYVDPKYVYDDVGDHPQRTYELFRKHPKVKGYCRVDANKSSPGNVKYLGTRKGW